MQPLAKVEADASDRRHLVQRHLAELDSRINWDAPDPVLAGMRHCLAAAWAAAAITDEPRDFGEMLVREKVIGAPTHEGYRLGWDLVAGSATGFLFGLAAAAPLDQHTPQGTVVRRQAGPAGDGRTT